ncbi:SH2B adapter protein 1 [Nematostella vectensis]|uniref:SH2B adapter protein 1 n=1 Tax=Nematostella vectensis TaxID=45351 RepID=UPI002077522E|nr:SH2B adapter protein 1 [Nematostella vectensis]
MACYNGEIGSTFPSGRWEEFCRDRAEKAAQNFAHEFLRFVTDNPVYDVSGASSTFSKRFVEYFLEAFDKDLHQDVLVDFGDPESPTDVFGPDDWGSSIHLTHSCKQADKKTHESSFMKRLKDVKDLFKRSLNEESIGPRTPEQRKPSFGDISEEQPITAEPKLFTSIKKESVMNFLMNLDRSVDTEDFFWQKCRVVLLKAPGGFMLEFYTPPKSVKPKTGIFCFLIHEARPATDLEMPMGDNVFVIKAVNKKEYMMAANSEEEMHSWLSEIYQCMEQDQTNPQQSSISSSPSSSPSFAPMHREDTHVPLTLGSPKRTSQSLRVRFDGSNSGSSSPPRRNGLSSSGSGSGSGSIKHHNRPAALDPIARGPPPELPPRSPTSTDAPPVTRGMSSPSTTHRATTSSEGQEEESPVWVTASGSDHPLAHYPWFHGTLSRIEASQLVSQGSQQWHGIFLIRQSETRRGEYVLTFNYQGRAKHLRLSLNNEGQCRVQHLWFPSIFEMLEHFRANPIPLESGGPSDVMLTNFVVSNGLNSTQTLPNHHRTNQGEGLRRAHSVQVSRITRPAAIQGGSVRVTIDSINQQPSRAVENQYAFV